jgi:hypothetical protein
MVEILFQAAATGAFCYIAADTVSRVDAVGSYFVEFK